MTVPLIAILGAGASRGSGDYRPHLRPPLTVELFDESLYSGHLRGYDLAHQAGRYITQERAADDALALEQALRDLSQASYPHHRHMSQSVPPYLQDLLHAVSAEHYADAFRYDRMIERLLRLPYVCFMTLNYDVILDRRLNGHHPLDELNDYVDGDKNWSLIKLHGSVNWTHPSQPHPPAAPPLDLYWDSTTFNCSNPTASLDAIRETSASGLSSRYPALALPEGPADRLVLPRQHAESLRQLLAAPEIDLLVIGYSGLDQEVLSLLASAPARIRRMTVVNTGRDDGRRSDGALPRARNYACLGAGDRRHVPGLVRRGRRRPARGRVRRAVQLSAGAARRW